MSYLAWLVPIAIAMGLVGLASFLWSMRNGQYEDLDGAAERILLTNDIDSPLRERAWDGIEDWNKRSENGVRLTRIGGDGDTFGR